mmetsp:Transcript_35862/g.91647  ORF Transcript_35862/g.91647 Transcript_35862/m.91647 type:complete len:652 (-) Transcript_35862:188-2143(-)
MPAARIGTASTLGIALPGSLLLRPVALPPQLQGLRAASSGRSPAPVGRQRGRVSASMAYLGVGVGIGALAGAAFMALRRRRGQDPEVYMAPTEGNKAILNECPSLTSAYKVSPWLRNPHVETIFAALFRRSPKVEFTRDLLSMEDGGTVAVDWLSGPTVNALPKSAPMLVLLPGLTGGSHDSYVAHMARAAAEAGIRPVVFNSRGTSDAPVTSPQFYSASYTDDLRRVLEHVSGRWPAAPLLAAGWSLGANILLNYLGEEGSATPVRAAVSLCNPFDLVRSDENFQRGFNRIYDQKLAKTLKGLLEKHQDVFIRDGHTRGIDVPQAMSSKSIREFDEFLTTKSFEWDSVDEYYAGSSSADRVPDIKIPVLCVQADNDPIAPREAIPFNALLSNCNCILVTTPFGGHLGWTAGPSGVLGEPWTDKGVLEYLKAVTRVRASMERSVERGGDAVHLALKEHSSRLESLVYQQQVLAKSRSEELEQVRQQLAAAQSEACEAQRARGVMVAQLEQAAARERQWHEAYQALQSELHSLRAWMHSPAASGGATNVQMAESTATGPDGNEAVQQLQAQVNALYARLEQQQVAAAGREAELQDLRNELSAAQENASQWGQAHYAASQALEAAKHRERGLLDQVQAMQRELDSARTWTQSA